MARRWMILIVAVCVVVAAVAVAYAAGEARDSLRVKDTKQFFRWYLGMKEKMPVKSEFETEAAYRKRIPPPFDSQKTIYFTVQREPHTKEYHYDLASKTLTLTAGRRDWTLGYSERSQRGYLGRKAQTVREDGRNHLLVIRMDVSRGRRYIGENAYGATAVVTEYTETSYALSLLNGDVSGEVRVDLSLGPEEAKRLSQTYEIVVGMKLPGYSHSEVYSAYREPTLDWPSDTARSLYVIDGFLHEVIVRDRSTRAIVKRLVQVRAK